MSYCNVELVVELGVSLERVSTKERLSLPYQIALYST